MAKRTFSREVKLEAVRRLKSGESSSVIAPALEIHRSDLYRWRRELEEFGDLEMTYQKEPPGEFAWKLRETWGGFTSMTLDGWRELFNQHGLRVIEIDDFSDLLTDLFEATKRELGYRGRIKLAWNLMLHATLRRRMKEYSWIFDEGVGTFGYAYLVGVKG